jgi:hypothetical protein
MTQPQRNRLAEAQGELLRALLADGPVPAGFAPDRLRVEADVLRSKRRRVVAMVEPEACAELDDRFVALFDEYARSHPRATGSRARDDARDFVVWLRQHRHLARPGRFNWARWKWWSADTSRR